MKSDIKTVLLTLALWLGTAMVPTESLNILPMMTVHLINDMKPGSATLSFHCKSSDDDLGFHQPGVGQEFKWTFSNNFWRSTLFHCNFWWNNMWIEGVDVYDGNREWDDVRQIYYKIGEYGIEKSYSQIDWIPLSPLRFWTRNKRY